MPYKSARRKKGTPGKYRIALLKILSDSSDGISGSFLILRAHGHKGKDGNYTFKIS